MAEKARTYRRVAVGFAIVAALGHLVFAVGLIVMFSQFAHAPPWWNDRATVVTGTLGIVYAALTIASLRARVWALLGLTSIAAIEIACLLSGFLAASDELLEAELPPELPAPAMRILAAAAGVALVLVPGRAWYWTRAEQKARGSEPIDPA